jgi:carbon-monoxide dehydrogenase large subunit
MDFQSELTVTRHYTPRQYGFTFTNGIQASLVEVDPDTGFVKLLKHWCVEDFRHRDQPDAGRRAAARRRGAGHRRGALRGMPLQPRRASCLNGNMADYLVPMSGEMPDIVCAHIETPTLQSQLGAKGVGEAGTAGAPAAIMNAINDALAPLHRA